MACKHTYSVRYLGINCNREASQVEMGVHVHTYIHTTCIHAHAHAHRRKCTSAQHTQHLDLR